MKVWKITQEDGKGNYLILENLRGWNNVMGFVGDEEVGSKYLMEVVEMSEAKIAELPEWDGF